MECHEPLRRHDPRHVGGPVVLGRLPRAVRGRWLALRGAATAVPRQRYLRCAGLPRLGRLSLLDYADALAAQITTVGERPIVIGHSMGGLLAQMLAARSLARAAVLLAPAAPAGVWAIGPSVVRSFWGILTTWAFWRKPVRQTFDAATYSLLHRLPPDERREVYGRFGPESGRVVFEIGLWLLDARHAARVVAEKVECPMLVVGGRQDRMTPAWALRRVARRYRATYREYEHHAHWLIGEPSSSFH